ncbi:hypothetical protein [Butyrivibrio proteoclasticus]|uniref:hypothetical protein n=1 Tax=Butyrivibrio proteoclasticus TaxID=43305 RepID=UPI000478BE59|nr:hypothetical protein [Butyrivibrio proteoclasticus]
MSEDFTSCENELKKNIEILDKTFDKFGLKVLNVGVKYANMVGGKGIKFYCEVMSDENLSEDINLKIKINVYSNDGSLISMGDGTLIGKDFTGYDTFMIVVFHEMIHTEAAKARVYLTKCSENQ